MDQRISVSSSSLPSPNTDAPLKQHEEETSLVRSTQPQQIMIPENPTIKTQRQASQIREKVTISASSHQVSSQPPHKRCLPPRHRLRLHIQVINVRMEDEFLAKGAIEMLAFCSSHSKSSSSSNSHHYHHHHHHGHHHGCSSSPSYSPRPSPLGLTSRG